MEESGFMCQLRFSTNLYTMGKTVFILSRQGHRSNEVMNQKDINLANRLKLSAQRALLGTITPNIRAVFAELMENNVQIYFYYDGIIQDDDEIALEVIADFDAE